MRHVVIAVLAVAGLAVRAHAQTPEPVRDQPHGEPVRNDDEPKPHGEPVRDEPHGDPVPSEPGPHGEPIHDGPHGEPVKPDGPGGDSPTTEPPNSDRPKTDAPKTDAPKTDAPKTDAPKTDAPKTGPSTGTQTGPSTGTKTGPSTGTTTQKTGPSTGPATNTPRSGPSTGTTGTGTTGTQKAVPAPHDFKPPVLPDHLEPMRPDLTHSTLPDSMLNADIPVEGEIKRIVVEGNKKTTSDTVILIARIEKGDHWSSDMVDVVKSRLVSSGLFKDIEVYWTKAEGGVEVHILAADKHSWVIAPAFYNQPTNTGGGVGFGENNLGGKNQKLLLYGQIATGDSFFIGAWVIPNLGGTRFYAQLDTYLKSARSFEYTAPTSYLIDPGDIRAVRESRMHYLNGGVKLGIELFRGVKLDGRIRGASVHYVSSKLAEGATIDDIMPGADPSTPIPNPGGEGADISTEWTFSVDRRANWYGVQTGNRYMVSLERSLPQFGSDFDYWLLGGSFFRAYQVLERHNLVFKGTFGYGHNLPFQQEYQTGGTSMRGWINSEFRGNLRTLVNVEYSVPVFTIHGFGVRGLAFFDSAYTTFTKTDDIAAQRNYLPGSQVRGLDGFKNSVGVGTRFYLRQIVLPLLGLDFGYGLEARDFQIYLAIGLTD